MGKNDFWVIQFDRRDEDGNAEYFSADALGPMRTRLSEAMRFPTKHEAEKAIRFHGLEGVPKLAAVVLL